MKMSASLEFVWQMAGQEALACQSEEIAPEHFFTSILKFAELDVERLADCVSEPGKAETLTQDVLSVRGVLEKRSMDGPAVRARLQAEPRQGPVRIEGCVIHRSAQSRAIFDAAVRLAEEQRCNVVAPVHLLDVLLVVPTEAIARAIGAPSPARESATPGGPPRTCRYVPASPEHYSPALATVQTKALIQALAHPSRKSVTLVAEDTSVVPKIVAQAAEILSRGDGPTALKSTRLVDISRLTSEGELDRALADAAGDRSVILYLPRAETIVQAQASSVWVQRLETLIEAKSVQCVLAAAPATYEDMIRRSTLWKRRLRPVWIGRQEAQGIPEEL